VEGALFGIKAAVLVIVVEALLRIGRRALKTRFLIGVAGAAFVGIFFLDLPFPLIVAAAAVLGYATQHAAAATAVPPAPGRWRHLVIASVTGFVLWWAPIAAVVLLLGPGHVLADIGLFFSKLAVVSFGGAYALLAYMAQQAVDTYHWIERAGDGRRPWARRDHAGPADPRHPVSSASSPPIAIRRRSRRSPRASSARRSPPG